MKNRIINILILLIISLPVYGTEKEKNNNPCGNPETITPSSASVFVEITNISRTIKLFKGSSQYSILGNMLFKYKEKALEIKNKTGIDLLNKESLKRAGFDINRSVYIAFIPRPDNSEVSVAYLPVLNKKYFSLFFVKLLKKLNSEPNADLNPAISIYNDSRVYQIQSDIFYTFINNYFILTQTGESLKSIIDLYSEGCETSLAANPDFIDYKNKTSPTDSTAICSIFISNSYVSAGINKKQKKNNINKISKILTEYKKPDSGSIPENNPEKAGDNPADPFPVKYISAGLKGNPSDITVSIMISTNKENESARLLAEMATTGLSGKNVQDNKIIGYYFLSFDFNKLYNYCLENPNQNKNICRSLKTVLRSMKRKGIQLEDPVFPCSKSFINIILKKSGNPGELDNFTAFIPMNECGDIEDMMDSIKESLEEKYPDDLSGKEKIDEMDSFWFINDDSSKINILEYDNDIYIGNNLDLIKKAVKSPLLNLPEINNSFYKGMDKNTFLFSNNIFDDDSFLKALLMMMAFRERPELFSVISKIKSTRLIGKRTDYDYNFELQINFISDIK